ncbi:fibroblast growth factor-binding protein 1 [Perognathus longimembris pacificus]|uniref:fibroblast growth factor-binding protein 1 n=1 Tax=Perognathus longimembris pacificus TaxID=214514 RepID=UPI002019B4A0|nr:fibroblast growth factor-binding protein 1 [Perognathus longimembris pacificus]
MRVHGLTLLSILFLAAQVLSEKGKHGAESTQHSMSNRGQSAPLEKAQHKQRSRTSKSMTNGKFVTKDQSTCRWAVSEQEQGITMKVECTRTNKEFSCVFAGNPTECLRHNKEKVYWKQISRTLRKEKNICGNAKSVLKTRVCKKKFPESNLKLISPAPLGNVKPRKEEAELSPREPEKVKGDPSSPAVTPTMTIKNSECVEDPDVANQKRIALEFCGESWSSFCSFFLTMFQATSC